MLYYNTVNELLKQSLLSLMSVREFESFRLVGGTSLSLQLGHRISVDIDLFTDVTYGSIDFNALESCLKEKFAHVAHFSNRQAAMGKSYTVGSDSDNVVKLDIFYADPFIQPAFLADNIRMATVEEIIAMKMDVVQRGGRKKDFWDLHELLPKYSMNEMLDLHKLRYEFNHDRGLILKNLKDFSKADQDFDPICLRGKYWEFIKEDLQEAVESFE
ncbi:nucleotidyl transferase AbiEii/AbiGii toxin family protein [Dyadobacter sp. 32]|uniref:nucleotidyl transferase AbiEii/AbiGii toxin family protein n=1 Tax=Dyadobacter sp. 32 TaxID=538966 RepID=UPI0011ED794A